MKKEIETADVTAIIIKLLTLENYHGKLIIGIRGTTIEYVEPDRILKVQDINKYLEE